MIHATNHVVHKKRVAWSSISMHACGSVPIVMMLRLAALQLLLLHSFTVLLKPSCDPLLTYSVNVALVDGKENKSFEYSEWIVKVHNRSMRHIIVY